MAFISAEDDAIFGAPPEEDEFSAFSKSGGLFSMSKGLFDDDADDEVKRLGSVHTEHSVSDVETRFEESIMLLTMAQLLTLSIMAYLHTRKWTQIPVQ